MNDHTPARPNTSPRAGGYARPVIAALAALFSAGCAMHSPTSAMFEFPFSMTWGHPPRLWANLAEVAQRDGVATYDYVIQGYPPTGGRIIATSRITAPKGATLTEKFETISQWKVRCFVQSPDGKAAASYIVSFHGNQFTVAPEKAAQ